MSIQGISYVVNGTADDVVYIWDGVTGQVVGVFLPGQGGTFPVQFAGATIHVEDLGTQGGTLYRNHGTGPDASEVYVIYPGGVIADEGAVTASMLSSSRVHVDNPTQGMECVLLCLGGIVAAICWRIAVGRW